MSVVDNLVSNNTEIFAEVRRWQISLSAQNLRRAIVRQNWEIFVPFPSVSGISYLEDKSLALTYELSVMGWIWSDGVSEFKNH